MKQQHHLSPRSFSTVREAQVYSVHRSTSHQSSTEYLCHPQGFAVNPMPAATLPSRAISSNPGVSTQKALAIWHGPHMAGDGTVKGVYPSTGIRNHVFVSDLCTQTQQTSPLRALSAMRIKSTASILRHRNTHQQKTSHKASQLTPCLPLVAFPNPATSFHLRSLLLPT